MYIINSNTRTSATRGGAQSLRTQDINISLQLHKTNVLCWVTLVWYKVCCVIKNA